MIDILTKINQKINFQVSLNKKIEDINFISTQLLKFKIDGLIVTNTTLGREGVENLPNGNEAGGLSGAERY